MLTPNNIYYTVKISFILTEYTYFFTKYDGNADDLLLRATELQNLTSVPAINRVAYFMVATGAIESLATHIPTREEVHLIYSSYLSCIHDVKMFTNYKWYR